MKNILITGDIKTGKSTLAKAIACQMGIPASGFLTLPYFEKGKREGFFLSKWGESPLYEPENQYHKIFCLYDEKRDFAVKTQVFESFGVQLAREALQSNKQLVVIDELGFMERKATSFQEEILKLLDSRKQVIAVVKPKKTAFLDAVRSKGILFDLDRQYAEDIMMEVNEMLIKRNNLYCVG
ncbi:hypothetical protein JR334_07155 [Clostridia bacterium]|nr:hypothetical protein JR334_07155 [Clostridia bacterium]